VALIHITRGTGRDLPEKELQKRYAKGEPTQPVREKREIKGRCQYSQNRTKIMQGSIGKGKKKPMDFAKSIDEIN